MFRRLHEPPATVTIYLDDAPLRVAAGDTVAAALLGADVAVFRAAPRHGNPRGPHCMIGNCYECLLEIDGMPYRQACLIPVTEGMRIRRPMEREAHP
jgi:NADH dehydrogenase/NADH:ubiquinone oxidoreductase subunit G